MIVFVGSNPSVKNPDPKIPFLGTRSGKVLFSWISQATDQDPSEFRFVNLSDTPTQGNGPLRKKDVNLEALREKLTGATRIVALGKLVTEILKEEGYSFLRLPHPSPRNRILNAPEKVQEAIEKLRTYLAKGPRLAPKVWYGFDHEEVNRKFEGGLTFVAEVPLMFRIVGEDELRIPAAVYRVAKPNLDKGHKELMALFRYGDQFYVTGVDPDRLEESRYVQGLLCPRCEDVIFSMSRHDFTRCSCQDCFVDGGTYYFRTGAKDPYVGSGVYYVWIDLVDRIFYPQDHPKAVELTSLSKKKDLESLRYFEAKYGGLPDEKARS